LESIDRAWSTLFSRVVMQVHHSPRRRGGARGASSAQQDGRVRRIGWLLWIETRFGARNLSRIAAESQTLGLTTSTDRSYEPEPN